MRTRAAARRILCAITSTLAARALLSKRSALRGDPVMGRRFQSLASALTGAVAAAGVTYYFDVDSGRRRRARLGERSTSVARHGLSRLQAASRDLAQRASGLGARATALLRSGGRVAAPVLAERVRARLGRVVSHPGAVKVTADDERTVRLTGAVLAWEHQPLRQAVAAVPGVHGVRDELQVYESADHVSALQGAPRRSSRQAGPDPGGSAALRVLMAVAGGGLLVGGARRTGTLGAVGAAAGGALLLGTLAAPRRARRQRGRTLEICQTLHLRAPAEGIYAALRRCDRLVALLPALRALRHRADGATQWTVHDPEGWRLDWTAVITELQPNRQIAWRSTHDSALTQWGMIWLEPIDPQQTRLHVYASVQPLPGRTGQALRRLLGTGPRGELTEHLGHLRRYLEGASAGPDPSTGAGTVGSDPLAAWVQPSAGRTH
jgi:uncharacterized membrane protein